MQIGTKLGAYEVLAKLGEGGMGEVYRVRDTKLERIVAVKVLPDAVMIVLRPSRKTEWSPHSGWRSASG